MSVDFFKEEKKKRIISLEERMEKYKKLKNSKTIIWCKLSFLISDISSLEEYLRYILL